MAATTHDRILDVAERAFGERGFRGTTLRAMTADAGVNLAAIHYHFGSKEGLFRAVVARRLVPLGRERLARLDDLEADAGDEPLPLEAIIETFVRPVLDTLLRGAHASTWMKMIGWCRVEPGSHWAGLEDELAETYRRFRAAFRRALADLQLPDDELGYRLFFFLGVEVNTLTDSLGLRTVDTSLRSVYDDPDDVLERLVRFVAAGLRAPYPTDRGTTSTTARTTEARS